MRLLWTDLAEQDLESIGSYVASVGHGKIAFDAVFDILNSVEAVLLAHPRAGRVGRVKGTREWVVDGQSFVVIYRDNRLAGCVEILRIIHDSQQWPIRH